MYIYIYTHSQVYVGAAGETVARQLQGVAPSPTCHVPCPCLRNTRNNKHTNT